MEKVFFCDLDDTLLLRHIVNGRVEKILRREDEEAIYEWLRAGNRFVVATARHASFLSVASGKPQLHFDTIGWNGAQIIRNDQILVEHPMMDDDVHWLLAQFPQCPQYIKATNRDNDYLFLVADSYAQHLFSSQKSGGYRKLLATPLMEYLQEAVHEPIMHLNFCVRDPKELHAIFVHLKQVEQDEHAKRFIFRQTSPCSIDVTHYLATKEQGIRTYAQVAGLQMEQLGVIGDSQNDIGMFQLVDHSFCMADGHPTAKQAATNIVSSVAEAIQTFL